MAEVLERASLNLPTVRGQRLSLAPRKPWLGTDPERDERWFRRIRRPTAVDLFSGAGGLGLGLEEAGFAVVAAADSDAVALETHAANLGGLTFATDLSDPSLFLEFLGDRGIDHVDLVAGGPPCQPFSRAGSAKIRDLVRAGARSATDDRIPLWRSFLEVVDQLRPNAVLLENVPDMATWSDGAIVVELLDALRVRGFHPDVRILRAWEYGVPQHRARLFVVGTKTRFAWPRRRPLVTLREAIGDLPRVPPNQRKDSLPYRSVPRSDFQRRARQGLPAEEARRIRDHCTRDVREDDARAYRLMKQGQTYRDLPAEFRRYRSDIFDDKYKRLSWNSVSRTITAHIAKDGYWYIHPQQHRTLSIREAARIQSFPDRFRFAGHPTAQFRQIGNAVPPALARAVGNRIRATLEADAPSVNQPIGDALRKWLRANQRAFPWRVERDPWKVLLTEMCLRRTRADAVDDIYERLMTIASTPAATLRHSDDVREALRSLGLRWRAENILTVAEEILERHDGEVPSGEAELRALTGVGDYVASAVRCFGFEQNTVLVDANTTRIVQRRTGESGSNSATRLEIYKWSGQTGPDETLNYALLDLGALVCKPARPLCARCPISDGCATASAALE